jgi:hypothetical protein
MNYLKIISFVLTFLISVNVSSNDNLDRERLNMLLSSPLGGISNGVWSSALTSYLSQCEGDCPCALVIAEGDSGDIHSTDMWIGAFKDGQPTELWSGRSARHAGKNRVNVSMSTDRCKKRNGVAEVRGNQACIPNRDCRPAAVYRALIRELGLPDGVALTSFYFSTPMQIERYKFHDFYACSESRCPSTLGCLGLERQSMKALCLNHMGSNGSNGIDAPERGGVWLYFHNTGRPDGNSGSEAQAARGLANLANGKCSNVSTAHLSSGQIMSPTSILANNRGSRSSGRGPASSSGGGGYGAAQLGLQGVQQVGAASQPQDGQGQVERPQEDKSVEIISNQCAETTSKACPNVPNSTIRDYCRDVERYDRRACEFEEK